MITVVSRCYPNVQSRLNIEAQEATASGLQLQGASQQTSSTQINTFLMEINIQKLVE